MRQVRFFVGRVLIASVAGLMLLAVPARADVITLHFQGAVDLTSEGGTTYTYSGHFTWNTAAAPFETEPDVSSYALVDYSLIFDGDDFSFAPSPDGNGNGLAVADDSNFGDPLGVRDAFVFWGWVGRPFDSSGDLFLNVWFNGPTDMFNSQALPANTDFLSDATLIFTSFYFEPDDDAVPPSSYDTFGTVQITGTEVVPEPATLALTAFGLAGALARARRARSAT